MVLTLPKCYYSQDPYEAIGKGIAKKKFKKAMELIEENSNRYFYKSGNKQYLGSSGEFILEDNNIYADVKENKDTLTIMLYNYEPSQKRYDVYSWLHTNSEPFTNTQYINLDGDVYIEASYLSRRYTECSYVLYNKTNGLYFHYCLRDEDYGKAAGGGFYKKTKAEKITSENLQEEKANFVKNNELFRNAVNHYEQNKKNQEIKKIMDKPDEGIVSDFQKQNIGKVLFGNNLTEANKFTAASYKSKFTIDEAVKATLFLDKGFVKYVDTTAYVVKENLSDILNVPNSEFKYKITLDNATTQKGAIYIKNDGPKSITSGVFTIVRKNDASRGNNYWLHGFFPDKIETKPHTVKIEVYIESNPDNILASGTYTYIPKPGAELPYGVACASSKEVTKPSLTKLKPRMKEVAAYNLARFNKKENRSYTFVNLSIVSDWIVETNSYGIEDKYLLVEMLCKDSKGNPFVYTDRFLSLDKSDTGYFDLMANGTFNVNLCDK